MSGFTRGARKMFSLRKASLDQLLEKTNSRGPVDVADLKTANDIATQT